MDINNDPNNHAGDDFPIAPKKASPIKKVITAIVAVVILAAIFYGLNLWSKKHPSTKDFNLSNVNSLKVDEKKQALEAQLEKYQKTADALAADAKASTKATTYSRMADIQIRLEQYQDAITTLDKIPEERKTSAGVEALYARAYAGLGDKAKALDYIKKSLATSDDVVENWQVYLSLIQDMDSKALNDIYFQALAKTNNNIAILTDFARSLEKRGDKPGAISVWEKAITLDSAHKDDYQGEINRLKQ